MLLRSEVTGMEYEITTYAMDSGLKGINHESLQDILENKLDGVSYDVEVITATETYCAAKCTITDNNQRKVQYFNDVNTNMLEGRDESNKNFTKTHPLIVAVQAAVDGAVRAYLKWPRVLPADDTYAGTSVITDGPANIPVDVDAILEEAGISTEDVVGENSDFGMNPPENGTPAETDAPAEANTHEAAGVPEAADASVETDHVKTDAADGSIDEDRLAELGKKKAPARSKYSNLTYDEIWDSYPNWFSYIKNNNHSKTYEEAREYAKLREAKDKGQQ